MDSRPIYIHIAKTGGKSIKEYFGDLIQSYTRAKDISYDKWSSTTKFTCVRHPLSRFVSAFYFIKRMVIHAPHKAHSRFPFWQWVTEFDDINEFVKVYFRGDDHPFIGGKFNKDANYVDLQEQIMFPQYDWHFDPEKWFDYIYKLESIQEIKHLRDKFVGKNDPNIEVPHANKTKHKKWKDVLTDESSNILHDHYNNDFERWEYSL
jgi:hypothetical protein